jgi:hypothetical protein
MTDPETGWTEPDVMINGHQLTFSESMSLRVAVGSFQSWLTGNRHLLGADLAKGYERHLASIHRFMLENADPERKSK